MTNSAKIDAALGRMRRDIAALTQKMRGVAPGGAGGTGTSVGGGVAAFAIDTEGNLTVGYAGLAPSIVIDANGFLQLEI